MTRDHEKYASLLDAFIDAELPENIMVEVGFHIGECPDCQNYMQDAMRIREAFPSVDETPVPADFAASVMAALPPQKGAFEMENQNYTGNTPETVNDDDTRVYNPDDTRVYAREESTPPANTAASGGQYAPPDTHSAQSGISARTWRNAALALAACLVVVIVLQFSGVFSRKGSSAEGLGAAMKQSGGADMDTGAGGVPSPMEEAAEVSEEEAAVMDDAAAEEADAEDASILQDTTEPEETTQAEADTAETPDTPEPTAAEISSNETSSARSAAEEPEYTANTTETEPQESDDTEGEPESILNGTANDTQAELEESISFDAQLTLPHDAAPIFSDFSPVAETSDGEWYAFTSGEYAILLEQLDGAGFVRIDSKIPDADPIYVFVAS